MKVSFSKTSAEVVPPVGATVGTIDANAEIVESVQGPGSATAVGGNPLVPATVPSGLPATSNPYGDEEIDTGDIALPKINIVQKVGEMSDMFPHGAIVFNLEEELPRPIRILVLGFAKRRFVEKVEGGGRGNIVYSEQEVVAAGGTTNYNEAQATEKPLYQRLDTALLLLECPEGVDPGVNFPHERNGKHYAVALWNLKGTAFTHGAKIIKTAKAAGHLRQTGYRGAWWTLDTTLKKDPRNNNSYFIPKLKAADATTPDFLAWIQEQVIGF